MNAYDIIKHPLVSEKSMMGQGEGRYCFAVDRRANKNTIRQAVEKLFRVHVMQIQTMVVRGKVRRVGRYFGQKPNWKKAFVTLKEGDKISLFEGV